MYQSDQENGKSLLRCVPLTSYIKSYVFYNANTHITYEMRSFNIFYMLLFHDLSRIDYLFFRNIKT